MQIDTTTYRKDTAHPARWGYQARGGATPSSIIIHTTSNKRATAFETEARFLLDSPDVSAHFLISKSGEIIQFLAPSPWQAWHAGAALAPYLNARSIGIEHHVSLGEAWTDAQHEATTWLVRRLMTEFAIPSSLVNTHRAVALPSGRKSDPTGWDDTAFYAWRETLTAVSLPHQAYKVRGLPVYQQSTRTGPLWGHLKPGQVIEIDDPSNGHISSVDGMPAPIGFVRFDPDTLEAMP